MAKAKTTLETLQQVKAEVIEKQNTEGNIRILVGMGTCGISAEPSMYSRH